MAIPTIKLLQEKPLNPYECDMCGNMGRQNKFSWESRFTQKKIIICRDCAYRERYGTKNIKKAKKERRLEEKKPNQ